MNIIKDFFYEACLLLALTMCVLIVLFPFVPISDIGGAEKALISAGYRNIEITGAGFFACGKRYSFSTKFNAKDLTGKHISGVVCSSFLYPSIISTEQRSDFDNYFYLIIILLGVIGGIVIFFVARNFGLLKQFYVIKS